MSPLSGFLIIINLFRLCLIQATTDSNPDCSTKFVDLIQICSTPNTNKQLYNAIIDFVTNKSNEIEFIEWLGEICPNAIKDIQCLSNLKDNLPDSCYNSNFMNYFTVDKRREETSVLCDNNAEGFKKLIPNDGLNLYLQGILFFNDPESLQSKDEVCMELKQNHLRYDSIQKFNVDVNRIKNDLNNEVIKRLIVRLNCTIQL